MLISSFAERAARKDAKRKAALSFLAGETWSGFGVLQGVLGISPPATLKTLQKMERDGLVRRHRVPDLGLSLWGITPHGVIMAADDRGESMLLAHFEPSKLKLIGIPHKLATQRARLAAESAGWTAWIPGHHLPPGLSKRPDARAIDTRRRRVAIEVERTVKTVKRYESIFAAYLQLIKQGEFDIVHYVCPAAELAPRLARLFAQIRAVPVLNERVPLNDRHRARFQVFALENWPQVGGMEISAG